MKKRDIKIGESYAVSIYVGLDRCAPRGTILADLGSGEWRVHFDSPIHQHYSYLRLAREGDDPKHVSHDCTVTSRDIFSHWDEYFADFEEKRQQQEQFQDQAERFKAVAEQSLVAFSEVIDRHGLRGEVNHTCLGRTGGTPESDIRLTITPELLDQITQALAACPAPPTTEATDPVSELLGLVP